MAPPTKNNYFVNFFLALGAAILCFGFSIKLLSGTFYMAYVYVSSPNVSGMIIDYQLENKCTYGKRSECHNVYYPIVQFDVNGKNFTGTSYIYQNNPYNPVGSFVNLKLAPVGTSAYGDSQFLFLTLDFPGYVFSSGGIGLIVLFVSFLLAFSAKSLYKKYRRQVV